MKDKTLSQYLRQRSKEICADNHCTEDQHNCESYAYIAVDRRKKNDNTFYSPKSPIALDPSTMRLLDICASDYFQGHSGPYAAIPLPWNGTQVELREEVLNQCWETIEFD
jgi:hypothetical protein